MNQLVQPHVMSSSVIFFLVLKKLIMRLFQPVLPLDFLFASLRFHKETLSHR